MQTMPGTRPLDDRALDDDLVLDEPEPVLARDGGDVPPAAPVGDDQSTAWAARMIDGLVVGAAVLFVLVQLGPRSLLLDSTPAGGDMGAHVWGPLYLRDHLLPSLRLRGWAPDWYAGFPAFRFYMVVPALAIVILNTGVHGWAALIPGAIAVVLGIAGAQQPRHSRNRRLLIAASVLVAMLGVGLPYGVAFKVIAVSGVVLMPLAAYAFGRLAGLPFPTPALMAAASLLFLFNREPTSNGTGSIIGGNMTSTLAGEYSFSIALSLGMVFLGLLIHGLRTGRHRPLAAVVLALTLTCHLIVGIFVLVAALIALVIWAGKARLQWVASVGIVGFLLGAFWLVPFLLGHGYVNDMGWEKSPGGIAGRGWTAMLSDSKLRDQVLHDYLFPSGLYLVIALATVGFAVSVLLRIRVGCWLALTAMAMGIGFIVCPEDRLWNARILPFYYLCLCLLAAIGVAEVVRAIALLVARDPARPSFAVTASAPIVGGLLALGIVAFPLQSLPGESVKQISTKPGTQAGTKKEFSWGPLSYQLDPNPARSWAAWNFSGYEQKSVYPEYHALMETMAGLGQSNGCGRAMWEYEGPRLNGYGTPMAPMLMPMWTDGCIGSMEGLYFESAMTTPFHFLNQSELSTACSCAQRNLPYGGFNIDLGVQHLQLLGVKYYMASTPNAIQAAQTSSSLTEVAVSGPWHVFEVQGVDKPGDVRSGGGDLVTPLTAEPAVASADTQGLAWVYGDGDPHTSKVKANGPATTWYLDPTRWDVLLASDGPASWQRVAKDARPENKPLPAVAVTHTQAGDDTISFDVDTVGVPVLVKVSYFPNWTVAGAAGPYRVAPNLMVVIPTSTHVVLHYGRSTLDIGSYALSAIGIGCLLLLARKRDVSMPALEPASNEVLSRYLEPPRSADESGPYGVAVGSPPSDGPAHDGAPPPGPPLPFEDFGPPPPDPELPFDDPHSPSPPAT
ncbi:MAG: 6-pyruvoyl-tetrahydropterin synthase-related protein [Acidimicrobiales bacterium]